MSSTTKIDDAFVVFLSQAFSLQTLREMEPNQYKTMRDCFICGMMEGRRGPSNAPLEELQSYCNEIQSQISFTKARHCVQEAIMIKSAEN